MSHTILSLLVRISQSIFHDDAVFGLAEDDHNRGVLIGQSHQIIFPSPLSSLIDKGTDVYPSLDATSNLFEAFDNFFRLQAPSFRLHGNQAGYGLASPRDSDGLPLLHLLQELGEMSFCIKSAHRVGLPSSGHINEYNRLVPDHQDHFSHWRFLGFLPDVT